MDCDVLVLFERWECYACIGAVAQIVALHEYEAELGELNFSGGFVGLVESKSTVHSRLEFADGAAQSSIDWNYENCGRLTTWAFAERAVAAVPRDIWASERDHKTVLDSPFPKEFNQLKLLIDSFTRLKIFTLEKKVFINQNNLKYFG